MFCLNSIGMFQRKKRREGKMGLSFCMELCVTAKVGPPFEGKENGGKGYIIYIIFGQVAW